MLENSNFSWALCANAALKNIKAKGVKQWPIVSSGLGANSVRESSQWAISIYSLREERDERDKHVVVPQVVEKAMSPTDIHV